MSGMNDTVLARAIERAGGVSRVAAALGLKAPSICRGRSNGVGPPRRVAAMAALTGVPAHILNPVFDIATKPAPPASQEAA